MLSASIEMIQNIKINVTGHSIVDRISAFSYGSSMSSLGTSDDSGRSSLSAAAGSGTSDWVVGSVPDSSTGASP